MIINKKYIFKIEKVTIDILKKLSFLYHFYRQYNTLTIFVNCDSEKMIKNYKNFKKYFYFKEKQKKSKFINIS